MRRGRSTLPGRAWRAALAAVALAGAVPAAAASGEAATAALFQRLRDQPSRLALLIRAMPKGGDLHNHLWGAPYAEEFIAWAGEDGLCVDRARLAIAEAPCSAPGKPPAAAITTADPALYSALIDSLSTRGIGEGLFANDISGHDRFFATFDKFAPAAARSAGRMVASARAMAANDKVSYLELMQAPGAMIAFTAAAAKLPFDPNDLAADLARLRPLLPQAIAAAAKEFAAADAEADRIQGCGLHPPGEGGCFVQVRYLTFALRESSPATVFAQLAFGFALAEADARVVGVNIVQPEDGPVSTADYPLHMAMFAFFHRLHPGVKIAMHAGELATGLVPPAALRDHIARAVRAGADRIGHGVDIAGEAGAAATLRRMAERRIAVEINLTSNDVILGVRGKDHPLALYRAAGVPFVLSTDDEGVSRIDMTHEYLRAATEQGLGYPELKQAARSSLEYAFLPGRSLWEAGAIGTRIAGCRGADPSAAPVGDCAGYLAASEKARAQWRLEGEFARFEAGIDQLAF